MDEASAEFMAGEATRALIKELRDAGWVLIPPRRVREMKGTINAVMDHFLTPLGEDPPDDDDG